jgi:hypothetical protein
MDIHIKIENRFWKHVETGNDDECWRWLACVDKDGYGKFFLEGKIVSAHRYSYKLVKGIIGEGLCICHRCDNPICVNPNHLFSGTVKDNNIDKMKKGRAKGNGKGELNTQAKLKSEDVIEIRQKYDTGLFSHSQLVDIYKVSKSQIQRIISKKFWKHI